MTRRKTTTAKQVTVKVAKSFDVMVIGEEFETAVNDRVLALVGGGFMEVVRHGESETGQAPVDAGDPGGEPSDAAPESPAGPEPGPDPGTG